MDKFNLTIWLSNMYLKAQLSTCIWLNEIYLWGDDINNFESVILVSGHIGIVQDTLLFYCAVRLSLWWQEERNKSKENIHQSAVSEDDEIWSLFYKVKSSTADNETHCIDNDIYLCWAIIRDILSCVESGDCKTVNVILITDRARCWEYRVMMGGMSQLIVELMIQQWCQDQTLTNFIADIDTFWTFL